MTKIVCIYSFQESNWISCQKIVFNLLESYRRIPDIEITPFNYDNDTTVEEIFQFSRQIQDLKPDKVIILDHKPHPLRMLNVLHKTLNGKLPEIVVHVFGDFTLYYRDWVLTEPFLIKQKVSFAVASQRQKRLIEKYLTNIECVVCPFPVEEKEFNVNEKLRIEQRKEWAVEPDAKVFVYTGRLSRQKRIHTIVSAFEEAAKDHPDAYLFFYGQTDHLGDHFLNIWETEGEYLRKLIKIHDQLPDELRSRVRFLGNVDWKKLHAVYNGADVFVSLSVHNDEDYGMSVAEAQACGLPCILSSWGGFSSFDLKDVSDAVKFVNVKFGKYNKLVSKQESINSIKDFLNLPVLPCRKTISSKSMDDKSINAVSSKLQFLLKSNAKEFEGFSPFLKFVASRAEMGLPLYMDRKARINNIYKTIYESYLSDH